MNQKTSRLSHVTIASLLILGACGTSNMDGAGDGRLPWPPNGLLAPTPIKVVSGSGWGSAASAESSSSRISSDSMYYPYYNAEYVLGEALPALPTNDTGYWFDAGTAVTADQVSDLAAVFGLTDEPVRIDDGYSVWWRVGPDDGSAPMLSVYEGGQQSWNYSGPWATMSSGVSTGCTVAVSSDGAVGSDGNDVKTEAVTCETIAPETVPLPVGVPTGAEAEAKLRALLVTAGEDPTSYTFETYADEWWASTSAVQTIGGLSYGRRWDVGFGAEGVLQYAGGTIADPVAVGPYPLIGIDEALARLNDQSSMYGGLRGGFEIYPAASVGVGSDTAVTNVGEPGIAAAPPESMPVDPGMPIDPGMLIDGTIPEPETVIVTLVDVQADLWWAWDIDGSVWLLPAYRFIDSEGGWHVVAAVADEYLVIVEQDPATSVPASEPAVEPPTGGADPIEPTLFDSTQLDGFVGLSLDEFMSEAKAAGASVRVAEQDGVSLLITEDYSYNRVNVAVTGDKVVKILFVG